MINIPFDKDRSHYLVVGVGKREDDSPAMAVSALDAEHLKRAFHSYGLFSNKDQQLLTNEEATKAGILDKLDQLATKTNKERADLVIIFFSGHGAVLDDTYYLICRDTSVEDVNTAIEGAVFVEKLKAIRCDKMLVLLDCCHSAGMTDIPFDKELILEQPNRVILTACAKSQLSYLSSPVSVFTYAVIEALGGKFLPGSDDKEVTVFNLAMDVRERVVALSEQVLKPAEVQKPQLNVLEKSGTTNFILARYPLGGPREIKIFKDEFAALKSVDGKDLNMEAGKITDKEYRDKFKWMITNTIVNSGDGNYIVQGSTINSGLSEAALKDILNRMEAKDKIIETLVSELKNHPDPASQALKAKIETVASFNEKEKKNLEEQLNLWVEKKGLFERKKIINTDPGTDFYLFKEIENIDKEISKVKEALNKI